MAVLDAATAVIAVLDAATAVIAVLDAATAVMAVLDAVTAAKAVLDAMTAVIAVLDAATAVMAVLDAVTAAKAVLDAMTAVIAVLDAATAVIAVLDAATAVIVVCAAASRLDCPRSPSKTFNSANLPGSLVSSVSSCAPEVVPASIALSIRSALTIGIIYSPLRFDDGEVPSACCNRCRCRAWVAKNNGHGISRTHKSVM
jgi:hypothetical protein